MLFSEYQGTKWTNDDEKEHYPSIIEWWCLEAFFKTIENQKKWSLKTTFSEYHKKKNDGSIFFITLFDQITGKPIAYYTRNDLKKLISVSDRFYIQYEDSNIQGKYPRYTMKLFDKTNKIHYDLTCQAISNPRWIAQDITDGWLPMGFGFYRYGFIPKCTISGTMNLNNNNYTVDGLGYFEHVWGDFSYESPIAQFKKLPKTLKIFANLTGWRLKQLTPKIPTSIKISTENNPFGYDWAWALLDNGWTVFYGNSLFWIMKGPAFGTLIISSDGKTYDEYGDIKFHYNEVRYARNYDFYYPSDFEIKARKGKKTIILRFRMTSESHEFKIRYPKGKYWLGYIICEATGIAEGTYSDGHKTINLLGISKIEPQRQISILGHNALNFQFNKPPNGLGIKIDFESHYLKKRLSASVHLLPKFQLKWMLERLHKNIKNAPVKENRKSKINK